MSPVHRPRAGIEQTRPLVRPGAMILRRSATMLQVGVSRPTLLKDRPGLYRALRSMDGRTTLGTILDQSPELGDGNTLVHELQSRRILGAATSVSAPLPASLVTHPLGDSFAKRLTNGLAQLADFTSQQPTVTIAVSRGEIDRSVTESFMAESMTHLPVVTDEDAIHVGPLVVPGLTPCLQCFDLAVGDADPAWLAMRHQFGKQPLIRSGTSAITEIRALAVIAVTLEALRLDSPAPTAGMRVQVTADGEQARPFGAHQACHCHLLSEKLQPGTYP